MISALGVELSFITGYLLSNGASVQVENGGVYPANLKDLLEGLFVQKLE